LSDEPHGTLLAQTIMRTRALGKGEVYEAEANALGCDSVREGNRM